MTLWFAMYVHVVIFPSKTEEKVLKLEPGIER